MSKKLKQLYLESKEGIEQHMKTYMLKDEKAIFDEMIFCTLTPQSNGRKCWEAVEIINKKSPKTHEEIAAILKGKARFHNTKAVRLMKAKETWKIVKKLIDNEKDILKLRNEIEKNVDGYGLKEASHFLRNIGLSNNKVAILDRHILRNLVEFGAINDMNIKGRKGYLELEQQALAFSDKVNIPIDHLDLLFWHKEHGEFFK